MSQLKPNHICKNVQCGRLYYACDYCGKTLNWRSMACSPECYKEYMGQIEQARSQNRQVNLYPERIDKTHEEVVELIDNLSLETVKANTMKELSDYKDDIEVLGLGKTMDEINAQLSVVPTPKRKRKPHSV